MKKEDVQITKKDGSKFVHGRYKIKHADKFVKWYKTDMKDTKSIKVILEADLTKTN